MKRIYNGGKYFQHYKLQKKFTEDVQSSAYPPPSPISKHLKFGRPPLPPPPPLSLDVIYVSFIFQFQLVPISYTLGRPFHLLLIVSIDVEKLVEFHILYFPLLLV